MGVKRIVRQEINFCLRTVVAVAHCASMVLRDALLVLVPATAAEPGMQHSATVIYCPSRYVGGI